MLQIVLMLLLVITGFFLILIVLIQRGRGGGLAGAFGGMGGQSAFGTKAGDMFTWITVYTAGFWIVLCAFSVKLLGTPDSRIDPSLGSAATADEAPGAAGGKSPAKKPGATGEKTEPAAAGDEPAKTSESKPAPGGAKESSAPAEAPAPGK